MACGILGSTATMAPSFSDALPGGVRCAPTPKRVGPSLALATGQPTRDHLPRNDVRMDLLGPPPTRPICASKGFPSFWSVRRTQWARGVRGAR